MATEAEAPESPRSRRSGQPVAGLTKRVRTTLSSATNPDAPAHERHVAQGKVVLGTAAGLGAGVGLVDGIVQLAQNPVVGPAVGNALASPYGLAGELGVGVPVVGMSVVMAMGAGLWSRSDREAIHRGMARTTSTTGLVGAATGITALGADVLGSAAHVAPGFMHGTAAGFGVATVALVGVAVGTKIAGSVYGTKPPVPEKTL